MASDDAATRARGDSQHGCEATTGEPTFKDHAIELADGEWAEHLDEKLAYIPDSPCLTDFNNLVDRLGHRLDQEEVDEFIKLWEERIAEHKALEKLP